MVKLSPPPIPSPENICADGGYSIVTSQAQCYKYNSNTLISFAGKKKEIRALISLLITLVTLCWCYSNTMFGSAWHQTIADLVDASMFSKRGKVRENLKEIVTLSVLR